MSLLVGPLLRYTDETSATLFVETAAPATVEARVGGRTWSAPTWSVHGHHYALVVLDDLTPATTAAYSVHLDGRQVWPLADSPFPPSVIRTPSPDTPFRLAFGSCRRSAPFDADTLDELGADALVALANRMVDEPTTSWPDALLMLGDQVYADDPSAAIVERLRERHFHDVDDEVEEEILDFEEYTWLYHEAWMVPEVRWLLSTVPSAMLLDDHDLRDDWNTSKSWRDWVTRQDWWHDRVVGGYGSYWVYQHLGNLSPTELAGEEVFEQLRTLPTDEERTTYLDDWAWKLDLDATTARFSFVRDLGVRGRGVRLVAIDSRCSRHLDPDDRRMVDPVEWAWVREQVLTDETTFDHLVLGSTLPFLMVPGVHHLEGWNEAVAQGAWGRLFGRFGEWFRQFLDLEHWAAFHESLEEVTDLLGEVVRNESPPATILMLGGDVHCSYAAHAQLVDVDHPATEVHQLTMSPFRNDIQRAAKLGNLLLMRRRWSNGVRRLARRARVPDARVTWDIDHGPWFDNGVMVVTFDRSSAVVELHQARAAEDGDQHLEVALTHELAAPVDDDAIPATI